MSWHVDGSYSEKSYYTLSICSIITINNGIAHIKCWHTGDLLKIGLGRPKKSYFLGILNVVGFQLLQKCPYQKCSFGLVFIDFTCVLSLLPGGWGDLLWLGTLSVTLPLHCVWSSRKPAGASCSGLGEGVVSTFVAAGDCEVWLPAGASSMVCGEAFSASMAAVMC